MQEFLLPILVAVSVAALVWAVARAAAVAAAGSKRKLKQRLSQEQREEAAVPIFKQIAVQQDTAGLAGALGRLPVLNALQHRISQAFPDTQITRFLGIMAASALVPLMLVTLLTASPFMGILSALLGAYVPVAVVNAKRNSRHRKLTLQLPEALDFLSRVLRAGHSLSTGLQMMGDELPAPLSHEFRRCYDQHSLGQSLDEALKEMAARMESTDFAFFVTAVLIQRQSGGDLAEVLRNISNMVRGRVRLQQSVKAKTAEGRLTGYIMVGFPAVMFFVAWFLNPGYGGLLLHTRTGLTLLAIAFALQMLGLFCIKKITTVRV